MSGRIVHLLEVSGLIGHVLGIMPDRTIIDYGTSDELLPGGKANLTFEAFTLPPIRHVCRNWLDWNNEPLPGLPGKEILPAAVTSLARPTPIPLRKQLLMLTVENVCQSITQGKLGL